jgi:hypothetical protein
VGLTLLFLGNVYWFSYLVFRDRKASVAKVDRDRPGGMEAAAPKAEEPPVNPAPPGA